MFKARYSLQDRVARANDSGATMVEYGLMVALIAVVVGGAAAIVGGAIAAMFVGLPIPN